MALPQTTLMPPDARSRGSGAVAPPKYVGWLAVLLFIAVWQLVASLHWISPLILPGPGAVASSFWQALVEGYRGTGLVQNVLVSLGRVAAGFGLAVLLAVPVGLWMGWNPWVFAVLDPFIEFLRPLPPLGYYAVLIVWFGIYDTSKVLLLFLAAFPALVVATAAAVRGVREDQIRIAKSLGLSAWQIFRFITFPACLPSIFTGARLSLGFTFTTLVAAEMVAADHGIGWMVIDASRFLRQDVVLMGNVVIGVIALLLDRTALLLQRRLVPWEGKG